MESQLERSKAAAERAAAEEKREREVARKAAKGHKRADG